MSHKVQPISRAEQLISTPRQTTAPKTPKTQNTADGEGTYTHTHMHVDLWLWDTFLYVCQWAVPYFPLPFFLSVSVSFLPVCQSQSCSSVTDSTMSLNIITVTLNMGEYRENTQAGQNNRNTQQHLTPRANDPEIINTQKRLNIKNVVIEIVNYRNMVK